MAEKKNNKYRLQLQEVALKDGTSSDRSIEFDFTNHDDLMKLIDMVKDSDRFEEKSDNIEFIVGLKLFSEVMLRNRTHPLFEDFLPSFGAFMKKVKGK